jgi:hypothetical protein
MLYSRRITPRSTANGPWLTQVLCSAVAAVAWMLPLLLLHQAMAASGLENWLYRLDPVRPPDTHAPTSPPSFPTLGATGRAAASRRPVGAGVRPMLRPAALLG